MQKAIAAVVTVVVAAGAAPANAAARTRCGGRVATIVGTSDSDFLEGTPRDDVIHGLGDFDTIAGLGGDDVICSGPGGAAVEGGAGRDTLVGSNTGDVLAGGPGPDVLVGNAGTDALAGGPGDDSLRGGTNDDILAGNAGDDRLTDAEGDDTASFATARHGVTVDLARGHASGEGDDVLGGIELVTGSRHGDRLLGSAGAEGLVGLGGDDAVDGRGGNDAIVGDPGDDRLLGGPGRDTIAFPAAREVAVDLARGRATGSGNDRLGGFEVVAGSPRDDTLRGAPGAETFLPGDGADSVDGRGGVDTLSYRDAEDGVFVDLAGHEAIGAGVDRVFGIENVRGSSYSDVLSGDAGRNVLNGGPGSDELVETAGDDVLLGGGPAHDTLDLRELPAGADVDLSAGTLRARGTDRIRSIDNVFGSAHADTIRGTAGFNRVLAGAGSDVIRGGGGFDTLSGDEGDDRIVAGDYDDEVRGGAGADVIDAGGGIDRVFDQDGDDRVSAGDGPDVVVPGAGDDTLDGGGGKDVLWPFYEIHDGTGGIAVDFAAGTATGPAFGTDTVSGFEGAVGTGSDDEMLGDEGPNFFFAGSLGEDLVEGRGGDDLLTTTGHASTVAGGTGDDYVYAPGPDDRVDGGAGADECWDAEVPESCERDETSPAPQFDPEFDEIEPLGPRAPRGVSAYVAGDGSIYGNVVTLLPLVDCGGGNVAYVERRASGGWRIAARVAVNGGALGDYRSRRLKVSGTYRVRLPSGPERLSGNRSGNCMAAVSEPVRVGPPGE